MKIVEDYAREYNALKERLAKHIDEMLRSKDLSMINFDEGKEPFVNGVRMPVRRVKSPISFNKGIFIGDAHREGAIEFGIGNIDFKSLLNIAEAIEEKL